MAADSKSNEQEQAVTKQSIREDVWNFMEKNNISNFPKPVYNRIPNFRGAGNACANVSTMDVFKDAKTVKIGPDKPQERCRLNSLMENKTLLVPTPQLKTGLFNRIDPPQGCGNGVLRICATSQGVRDYSTAIELESKVKVDLIIIGSVAVSRKGYRLGKGEGYGDLEYAMMASMGAIDENTPVITVVHECQVVDIPKELMEEHDVLVDYIVTEKEVIKCDDVKRKFRGIIWSSLKREKLRRIPILRRLREIERAQGIDVTLKDGDLAENGTHESDEDEFQDAEDRPVSQKQRLRDMYAGVYIGGIHRGMRISELKHEIRDLTKVPYIFVWRTKSWFAFLRCKNLQDANDIVADLRGLMVGETELIVELSEVKEVVENESEDDIAGDHENNQGGSGDSPRKPQNRIRQQRRQKVSDSGDDAADSSILRVNQIRAVKVGDLKHEIRERSSIPFYFIWSPRWAYALLKCKNNDIAKDLLEDLHDLTVGEHSLEVEISQNRKPQRFERRERDGSNVQNDYRQRDRNREERPQPISESPVVYIGGLNLRISDVKREIRARTKVPFFFGWYPGRAFALLKCFDVDTAKDLYEDLHDLRVNNHKLTVEFSKKRGRKQYSNKDDPRDDEDDKHDDDGEDDEEAGYGNSSVLYVGGMSLRISALKDEIHARTQVPYYFRWSPGWAFALLKCRDSDFAKDLVEDLQDLSVAGWELNVEFGNENPRRQRSNNYDNDDGGRGQDSRGPRRNQRRYQNPRNRQASQEQDDSRLDEEDVGPSSIIYIGNIPRSVRLGEIKEEISKRVQVQYSVRHPGAGYAFLKCSDEESAQSMYDSLQGMQINNKELTIQFAKSDSGERRITPRKQNAAGRRAQFELDDPERLKRIQERREARASGSFVYITNYGKGIRVKELREAIAEHTELPFALIWRRFYSFLKCDDGDSASQIVNDLAGLTIHDQELKVEIAQPNMPESPGNDHPPNDD